MVKAPWSKWPTRFPHWYCSIWLCLGLSGADVLDQMRSDARLRQVPVIILSNKFLSLDDIKRLEYHTRVTLQNKDIWTENESLEVIHRALAGDETLPAHTSALVKRVLVYIHQNYARPLTRWEIAQSVGISEDYLTRLFNRELGISPWDYLNRYRILKARTLLTNTSPQHRHHCPPGRLQRPIVFQPRISQGGGHVTAGIVEKE